MHPPSHPSPKSALSESTSPASNSATSRSTHYHSRRITSAQEGVHERLAELVKKHLLSEYQKPIQDHNIVAFDEFREIVDAKKPERLILDSCCGTGMSSYNLAAKNPDAWVIGIDQSISRLERKADYKENSAQNVLLLRANCEDFWRLCAQHNITFAQHYILYPNPYPKPGHLQRRWHGHPVFPVLPRLSDSIEVRSNWALYVQEFALAWALACGVQASIDNIHLDKKDGLDKKGNKPLTLFEKKYSESGQPLWRLRA